MSMETKAKSIKKQILTALKSDWKIFTNFLLRHILLSIVVFILSMGVLVLWFYLTDGAFARFKDLIKFLGYGAGGVVAAWGASIAWQRVQVMQDGNITERFSRAVEQLGSGKNIHGSFTPNKEIRIGGVYALGEIARESPKYFIPVMEILSAYVRKNDPYDMLAAEQEAGDFNPEYPHEYHPSGNPVTGAILKVIGTVKRSPNRPDLQNFMIDLSESNFNGYTRSFEDAEYEMVNFSRSYMQGDVFIRTKF